MRILADDATILAIRDEFDIASEDFKATARELESVMEEIKNGVIKGPIAKAIYDVYEPQKDAFAQTIKKADEVMDYLNMQSAGLHSTVDDSTNTIKKRPTNIG